MGKDRVSNNDPGFLQRIIARYGSFKKYIEAATSRPKHPGPRRKTKKKKIRRPPYRRPKSSRPQKPPSPVRTTTRKRKPKFSPGYIAYLESSEWQQVRRKVLERDGYKCQTCGSTKILQVHHLTYKRLFKERLSDLTTLCKRCHMALHDRKRKAS